MIQQSASYLGIFFYQFSQFGQSQFWYYITHSFFYLRHRCLIRKNNKIRNNYYSMVKELIFIVLVSLSSSLSAPVGGYCPWTQYTTTDSYTFDTKASYNNTTPYTSPMIATVPFANAQANNFYQLALSFQNLDYDIVNYRISISIKYTNPQFSSFDVNVYSAFTNCIRQIGFRYLVINSNGISSFSVSYITFTLNSIQILTCKTQSFTSFTLSSTSNLAVFTGLDFDYTSVVPPNYPIVHIHVNNYITSSVELCIHSYGDNNIMMYQFSILFLRYSLDFDIKITFFNFRVDKSYDTSNPYNTRDTLFGLFEIYLYEKFLNFNFSVINGNLSFTTTNYIQQHFIHGIIIQKYYSNCCSFPTVYYYSAIQTCFDICPPRLYGNLNFSCLPCPFDCLYCNKNGNGDCISCLPNDYRTLNIKTNRCVANLGYYSQENISQAQPCAYDCIQCNSLTVCQICVPGKIPVTGGCSNVFGCAQVSVNFTSNTTNCTACKNQFILTNDHLCSCPQSTWLVTHHCTNVSGCLATTRINNVTQCVACKQHFAYGHKICACVHGFLLQNALNACIEICGDGILFVLQCDDGNLINGDGCSSNCRIQANYKCFAGSQNHSSLCYSMKNYQITVDSIDKSADQNQGIFVFKITPQLSQISSLGIIEQLTFSCYEISTVTSWSFEDNILTVRIDYQQNLQGNAAELSLKLNQTYISQSYLNLTFNMKSKGVKLIIYDSYDKMQIIQKILYGISISTVLLFVLGSIAHKMIGTQVLTTFQIILFTSILNTKYTQPYNLLNYLSPVSGNYYYFTNHQSNYYSDPHSLLQLFTFNKDSLLFTKNVTAGILICCCLIIIGRIVLSYIFGKINCQVYLQKVARFLCNHIVFPLAIGFLFINVFSYTLSSQAGQILQYQTSSLPTIVIRIFLTIATSLLFFYQLVPFFVIKLEENINYIQKENNINQFQRCNKNYIPAYLLFIYVQFTIFLVANICNFTYSLYLTTFITLLYFVWFISHKPYEDTIHNIGQILNISLLLMFQFWSILREFFPEATAEKNEIIALYCFSGLTAVILLLTTVRVIIEARRKFVCSPQKFQSKKVKMKLLVKQGHEITPSFLQSNDNDQMMKNNGYTNPYSLKTQLLREQKLKWNEINEQRLLNHNEPLYSNILQKHNMASNIQDIKFINQNVKKESYINELPRKIQRLKDQTYLKQKTNQQITE